MIFHAEKRSGFVMLDNAWLNDNRLSLRAKGLLAYLLSKPPHWAPQVKEICSHCKEGREAVETSLRELEALGYAKKITLRGSSGGFQGKQWCIFERPDLVTEEPKNRKPVLPVLSNTEVTRKTKAKEESDLREVSCQKVAEFIKKVSREALVTDAKQTVERVLGYLKGTTYWNTWLRRAEDCPFRTELAVGWLEEDLTDLTFALRHGVRGSKPIRDKGAKANWYFNRIDLETGKRIHD